MLAFTRTLSLMISTVIICAIFYNVISNYFVSDPNKTLFASDPFNFQNRITYLDSVVIRPQIAPDELERLQGIADAGIILEPINANILSLSGALKQRTDKNAAQAYYIKALGLKPTDRLALTQRYIYLVDSKAYKEAIPLIELISARWVSIYNQLQPSLPYLLQTQENIDDVLERFKTRLSTLKSIVQSVVENTGQVEIARKLVIGAHEKYNIDVHDISNPITRKLLKQDRISEAYLLFYKTLFEEEKKNLGYVFNSQFLSEPTADFFDWDIQSQAGVNMQRIPTRVLSAEGVEQSKLGGLEIKFLNAPVIFNNVSQLLYLPKQVYELSVNYSVKDFSGPDPISVKLLCANTNSILTQIELSKEKTTEEVKTVSFEVTKEGCELQKVLISNNNNVESWQNRFSGKVTLHEIRIKVLST